MYTEFNQINFTDLPPGVATLRDQIQDEYYARINAGNALDMDKLEKGVNFFFQYLGLSKPEITLVDNPARAQEYARNVIDISNSALPPKELDFNVYISAGALPWYSTYEALTRMGLFHNEFFESYKIAIESGAWDSILFEDAIVVVRPPVRVDIRSKSQHHNPDGPYAEFGGTNPDGTTPRYYALHGLELPESTFNLITDPCSTAAQIMAIENIEHRMIALRTIGASRLLQALNAEHLAGPTEKGNEAYKIPAKHFGQVEYALRYKCPSTDQEFVKFVEYDEEANDPDLAQAQSFQISKDAYMQARWEV